VDGLVQSVDLFHTLLNVAGLEVPHYAQGKDLVAWVGEGDSAPLHDVLFAQVGDYHGHLKNTLPSGTFESWRRHQLVQAARITELSYIRDPNSATRPMTYETIPLNGAIS